MKPLKNKKRIRLEEILNEFEKIKEDGSIGVIDIIDSIYSICCEIREIKSFKDKKQRWIRLFNLTERTHLEKKLNLFLRDYPDSEIRVWNDSEGYWNAQVIYSYPEPPTYSKPSNEEES